ncbi:hypothetical protein IEO21_06660 [Rhodonia placenta]|uniref:Probable RNA polymerase II nuclear localization protein SLC7A6OS n=1 Tax=Rhodonia placenta TaxID=104341 RepID=A0A8H7U0J1_9APHY|nr:hypothetical protein IEO21_06660 [Postia placenta]
MSTEQKAEQQLPETPERPYAIVRIKRKRNEEPLDGLVVDPEAVPSRKRSRGALNFFKFAETARLSTLARESPRKENLATSVSAPAVVEQAVSPAVSTPRPQLDDSNRRYTIVKRERPGTERVQRRVPTAPPKVWSTKELQALRESQSSFAMYDAIPSSSALSSKSEVDPEVAKFLPLLRDYLKLDDPSMGTPPGSMSTLSSSPSVTHTIDDSDYVYDVFYQRLTTLAELYEPGMPVWNIGTLTEIPEELMMYDSDDDSEVYDTDDEDSNAEDFYKNDYPDGDPDEMSDGSEGSVDPDVFHEDSDYDDMIHGDTSDHEWR